MIDDENRTCFVIGPIGADGSAIRKQADQLLNHIVKPVATKFDLEVVRADQIDRAGLITTQIIEHVIADAIVVADLTDRNPNVYYELAARHLLRRPFIQVIAAGQDAPFDVSGVRHIKIDYADWDSPDRARQSLSAYFAHFLGEGKGKPVENPFSVAIDNATLLRSSEPGERQLAQIANALSDLRSSLLVLDRRMARIEDTVRAGESSHFSLPNNLSSRVIELGIAEQLPTLYRVHIDEKGNVEMVPDQEPGPTTQRSPKKRRSSE